MNWPSQTLTTFHKRRKSISQQSPFRQRFNAFVVTLPMAFHGMLAKTELVNLDAGLTRWLALPSAGELVQQKKDGFKTSPKVGENSLLLAGVQSGILREKII